MRDALASPVLFRVTPHPAFGGGLATLSLRPTVMRSGLLFELFHFDQMPTAPSAGKCESNTPLHRAGLRPGDVTLVNPRPQDMPAALASGSIDAYDSWEPFIANGKKALGADAHELPTAGVYAETFNIVVGQAWLQKHHVAATALLRSPLEAEQWLKAHPGDAVTTIATATRMPRDDLAAIWHDYVFGLTLDARTVDTLRHHAE